MPRYLYWDIESNNKVITIKYNQMENKIEQAKDILRSAGYFVDNLWQTEDVTMNYNCTEEEAQEVLYGALTNDATYQQIWEAIRYETEAMNLKHKD